MNLTLLGNQQLEKRLTPEECDFLQRTRPTKVDISIDTPKISTSALSFVNIAALFGMVDG
jgi:hypothetical protein